MKALRPITTLSLGPLLLAVAVAAVGAAVQPDLRTPRGMIICGVVGAAVGVLVFAPIAAGGTACPRFVRRHFEQFERWSSVLLSMGLGHLLFLRMGSAGGVVALALVFLSACLRVYLSELGKRHAVR
jgi:hypothetical protein